MQLHRKRYELLQLACSVQKCRLITVTIPQAVWAVATKKYLGYILKGGPKLQYRKRYELLQRYRMSRVRKHKRLQYRKRYELLQHTNGNCGLHIHSYNTASGMSCCNFSKVSKEQKKYYGVTIPQAVWAVATEATNDGGFPKNTGYNTASGMSCCNQLLPFSLVPLQPKLQYRKRYELLQLTSAWFCMTVFQHVTIPQAVWAVATFRKFEIKSREKTCYNTASGMSCCNQCAGTARFAYNWLQYRKRYELLQRVPNVPHNMLNVLVTIPQAVWAVATEESI